MTKYIGFTKMHGAGNDYIYIDATAYPVNDPEKLAIEWSKFHTGIGSDGLVLIGRTDVADFSMRIFNADGSEALMCGNATRCIGKFVYDNGLTQKDVITLETLSGIKTLNLKVDNKEVKEVTVDMGAPGIGETALEVEAKGRKFTGTVVSMGNPHLVIFVDDIETVALEEVGPVIEYNPLFPNRTNVEFVQLMDDNTLRMRVWERGSGITQACGTGACATAVAANITGRAPEKVRVVMDGGPLSIEWDKKKGAVFMTGGATKVFEGTIAI